MPSVNSLAVYVAVGAGPRYETEKTAGLAHFLEHMLFEGTKKLPTSKDLAEYIERVGGKSSAWTSKEYVSYYAKVPKQHLNVAFAYLSDILFNSKLEKKAIEKEKDIVFEELKRSRDNPEVYIWDLWLEWIWSKKQSLGRFTLGDEKTIKNITKQKLQDYMNRFYRPANMAVAVAGNFSIREAEQYAFKYFGQKQDRNVPKFEKLTFVPKRVHAKIIKADTKQVQLILGFVTNISYSHKDRFSMRVIADILSAGVSSRLFHRLVYDLGIAYVAGAQAWTFIDTGLFYIYGGFAPQNLEKAIKTILEELDKLKKEKITVKELIEAKEKDKAELYFSLETPDAIANWYASQQITEKSIMTIEEMLRKIDKVTAENIQRVARQCFTSKNLCLTIRGPIKVEHGVEHIEATLRRSDKL